MPRVKFVFGDSGPGKIAKDHKVAFFPGYGYEATTAELKAWCEGNLTGDVEVHCFDSNGYWSDEWRFSSADDLILFRLTWNGGLIETDDD